MADSKIGSVIGSVILAAACVTGGWVASGTFAEFKAKKMKEAMAQQAKKAMAEPSVATNVVRKQAYNLPKRYIAHAEAVQEVDLLPQVDGYVKEIKFKEGDLVKEGDLLYVLDDEKYRAVVGQAQADLNAAKADLNAANTEVNRARRYFERMESADARGITQKARDDAEADAEKAIASAKRSEAAVAQAEANLVVAEYNCRKARIYAPITGQIGKTTAHIGDYVAPSKGPLAHIMQTDPIRVTFPLTDRDFLNWREASRDGAAKGNLRNRLLLPNDREYAVDGRTAEGEFAFDDNQMSRETATIIMRLTFPNPERLLVPNSYLTVLSDERSPRSRLCVPQQSVVDVPGGSRCVYVLKSDFTVEQRIVSIGGEPHDGWVPVDEGLSEGETVVVSGVSKLRPGVKVCIAEPTPNDDLDPNYKPSIEE